MGVLSGLKSALLRLSFLVVASFFFMSAMAQELNCTVELNADQVQATNRQVFETLKNAMSEYMNTTHFTNAQFSANEKIDCRLYFTIKEYNDDVLVGDLQVQSSRPVFNSSYTTTLLNFKDTKIEFTYRENEPLVFNLQNFESQITAILNYYAYLIIALDFDSFSPRGGDQFYEILENIVQGGQTSGETGWKAFEDTKNRAAVLAAYKDPSTSPLRDLLYIYHRKGLDEMSVAPDKGRQQITLSLDELEKVFKANPMSVGLSMFKDAKLDELVNVYTKGTADERKKVSDLLAPIYPTEMVRINMIKEGKNE